MRNKRRRKFVRARGGQALIELLVGVTVAGVILVGAVALILQTVRISGENKFIQGANFLAKDMVDKLSVYADRQWYCDGGATCIPPVEKGYGVYNLAKGEENQRYYLDTESSPFASIMGEEDLMVSGVPYTRYFYVENVCRNADGNITNTFVPPDTCSVNEYEDPSTQFLVTVTKWFEGENNREIRLSRYVARTRNFVIRQTDWSGGAVDGVVVSADAAIITYEDAESMDTGTQGSFKLEGYP
jgi:type II secretory pathway pseudopilin PulG